MDHLFGIDAPGPAVGGSSGDWYTQTLPEAPWLRHWQRSGDAWVPATEAPIDTILPGEGWWERALRSWDAERAAFLPPGEWALPDTTLQWNGRPFRLAGIPGRTLLLGRAAPTPGSRQRRVTRTAWALTAAPSVAIHGVTLDGGVGVDDLPGWVPTSDPGELASLLELRRCGQVRLTSCTFTRCRGSLLTPGAGDLAERWNQGMCFALACAELSLTDCGIAWPAWIEGIVAIDCAKVRIDRFRAVASPGEVVPSWGLSTPLHCFGPATGEIRISEAELHGHLGSAMNLGGQGPIEVADCRISGVMVGGRRAGGGIDCGDEMATLGWPAAPPLAGVRVVRNDLRALRGAAIKVGGGSPELTLTAERAERRGGKVEAAFPSGPAFVPGQMIQADGAAPIPVEMVDRGRHTLQWPSAGPDAPLGAVRIAATDLLGTTLARKVVIAANTITGCEAGIDLRAAQQVAVLRNVLRDILAGLPGGPQGVAIQLIGVDGGIVDGNQVGLTTAGRRTAQGLFTWDCARLAIAGNQFEGVAYAWVARAGPRQDDPELSFTDNRVGPGGSAAIRLEGRTGFPAPTLRGNSILGRAFGVRDVVRVHR